MGNGAGTGVDRDREPVAGDEAAGRRDDDGEAPFARLGRRKQHPQRIVLVEMREARDAAAVGETEFGDPAYVTALPAQPTAPVSSGPNSCHPLPSNLAIWTCLTGAKSVGVVLTLIPGSSIGTVKS